MLLSLNDLGSYQRLFGMNDSNLSVLEEELSVSGMLHGQELRFTGNAENVAIAEEVVTHLLPLVMRGATVDALRIRYAIELCKSGNAASIDALGSGDIVAFTHRGRPIRSKTLGQSKYIEAVRSHQLTLAVGPAGTYADTCQGLVDPHVNVLLAEDDRIGFGHGHRVQTGHEGTPGLVPVGHCYYLHVKSSHNR